MLLASTCANLLVFKARSNALKFENWTFFIWNLTTCIHSLLKFELFSLLQMLSIVHVWWSPLLTWLTIPSCSPSRCPVALISLYQLVTTYKSRPDLEVSLFNYKHKQLYPLQTCWHERSFHSLILSSITNWICTCSKLINWLIIV